MQPYQPDPVGGCRDPRVDPQFEEKGDSLVCDIPADLPTLALDADRISQVLINLVGNARQYTPSGGKVSVTARLSDRHPRLPKGRWVLVSVQDSGSGSGLSIAKHLVEAHGGHIWAESAGAGQGSTFTFALPA